MSDDRFTIFSLSLRNISRHDNCFETEGKEIVRHRDVVGRFTVFQPGGPGSIPGWLEILISILNWVCVLCLCPFL